MSKVSYSAYRKKRKDGGYVWGVLRMEGRKQQFRTVGTGVEAERKAEELAVSFRQREGLPEETEETDRFLSWHRSGEPLPLDRAVRDHARAAEGTVASSTATRYRQFAERLAARLGSMDLRRLQKEDVGKFVREEHADGRAPEPTINACVLLRGTVLHALRTKDELGKSHLVDDPLPRLMPHARKAAKERWRPALDGGSKVDAWAPDEVQKLLELARQRYPDLYSVCLFQLSTGCRIGEALAMRWSAVDLDRGEATIRLKI